MARVLFSRMNPRSRASQRSKLTPGWSPIFPGVNHLLATWGMRKVLLPAAEELLETVMRLYQRASTILTFEPPVEDRDKPRDGAAVIGKKTDYELAGDL